MSALLPLGAALLSAAVGLAALSSRRRGAAHWAFAVGMLLLAAQEACRFGVQTYPAVDPRLWWMGGRAAAYLLPVPWLLFGLLFAEAEPRRRLRRAWPWVAGVAAVGVASLAGLLTGVLVAFAALPGQEGLAAVLTGPGKAAHVALVLALVLVLVHFESTLRTARLVERWRIKYLILGLYAAFAVQIYEASQALLYPPRLQEWSPVESSGVLLALLLLGVALVRHRAIHAAIYISRPVMYRTVTLLLVGAYLILLGVSGQLLRSFGIAPEEFYGWVLGFAGLLALAVVVFSERMRRRLRHFVDTHFYHNKYDYRRRWLEFTQSLGPAVRLEEVLPRLVDTLMQTMWVERAGVFLMDARGERLALAHASNAEEEPGELPLPEGGWAALRSGRVVDTGDSTGAGRRAAYALVAPLQGPEGLMGALAVGRELTGKPFTAEDRDLLATIAGQAATAMLTARLSQDLAAAKGMEILHRVTAFLLHDLKNCASVLTMVSDNAREHIRDPEFQREALAAISVSAAKMRRMIAQLSNLRAGPEMERERLDLARAADEALEDFRKGLRPEVILKCDLRPTGEVLADRAQVGRVLTNLLVNAAEAVGEAGEVFVESFTDGPWACLRVRDTGRGIPAERLRNGLFQPFRSSKPGGLGIGLYQCKTIVEAHGGRIAVESAEGTGATFTVSLPLATAEQSALSDHEVGGRREA